jgi:hypothetical protein
MKKAFRDDGTRRHWWTGMELPVLALLVTFILVVVTFIRHPESAGMGWGEVLGGVAGGLVALIVIGAAYFLPTIVAPRRGHHQTMAISVLNLLLGWTVLGWIAALVWACTRVVPTR